MTGDGSQEGPTMSVKIGVNGFGRIGRNFFRAAKERGADFDFVAANDLISVELIAHLLKYDTILGTFAGDVEVVGDGIKVDGDTLRILAERDPKALPWGELGVDVVVESSGLFTTRETAGQHLVAGAPLVIVSAPGKDVDATFVVGVNDDTFDRSTHHVVSNASCTTNCFVPMVKVLDDAFGVDRGLMTTVHAYTGTQALVDGPSKDLREARAAALNIIPASTGAARATGLVLQSMNGRLDGQALRVPVADGSITDFTAILAREVTVDDVNGAFRAASESGPLSGGILVYSEAPIVSSDIVGSPASCTFDAPLTMALGNLVKVMGWYDNEWGYSNRLVDLVERIAAR
jgi:glyceraldehyde 3-phosphate dehydrogenase